MGFQLPHFDSKVRLPKAQWLSWLLAPGHSGLHEALPHGFGLHALTEPHAYGLEVGHSALPSPSLVGVVLVWLWVIVMAAAVCQGRDSWFSVGLLGFDVLAVGGMPLPEFLLAACETLTRYSIRRLCGLRPIWDPSRRIRFGRRQSHRLPPV